MIVVAILCQKLKRTFAAIAVSGIVIISPIVWCEFHRLVWPKSALYVFLLFFEVIKQVFHYMSGCGAPVAVHVRLPVMFWIFGSSKRAEPRWDVFDFAVRGRDQETFKITI